jgi:hypothetical protein
MSDELIDVRVVLAASPSARVERGRDGVLHVHVGPVTVHLDRGTCEELSSTLARAVSRFSEVSSTGETRRLRLLQGGKSSGAAGPCGET